MMRELSLHLLDLAQNSIAAGANLITITVCVVRATDRLTLRVADNGSGMSPAQAAQATDPFFTTRTTRTVGLGLAFFQMAAELTGGCLSLSSVPGRGTRVTATFGLSHINRMPMGNLPATISALIQASPSLDFVLHYRTDHHRFTLDTRRVRTIVNPLPINSPEVLHFLKDFLSENIAECGVEL